MRKWMRERLQRRKKSPAETPDQPAPPPLQPAYFDAEQSSEPGPDSGSNESEVSKPSLPAPQSSRRGKVNAAQIGDQPQLHPPSQDQSSQPEELRDEPSAASPASRAPAPVGRSRRRRGGRGRGGRGREQAVAQAFTPAAVKGSIPVLPVDPTAEGEVSEIEPDDQAALQPVPAAPAKTASAPIAAPRPPKGVVVLAIGLPGSGKSSWFKRHNVVPLSSDMVRTLL